jgi:hypothetical protein
MGEEERGSKRGRMTPTHKISANSKTIKGDKMKTKSTWTNEQAEFTPTEHTLNEKLDMVLEKLEGVEQDNNYLIYRINRLEKLVKDN